MEYNVLVAAILFSVVCVHGRQISSRIASGTQKNVGNLQYFINLAAVYDQRSDYCTGYLLSEKAILTAAHCFEKLPATAGIYYSTPNGTLNSFEQVGIKVNLHPNYKENDLAVVSVLEPLNYEPIIDVTSTGVGDYITCRVSGLGATENGENYDLIPYLKEVEITACQDQPLGRICATAQIENRATGILCKGDAGAPLVCNNELVGIAVSDNSCGAGDPDVYQSLKDFKQWIEEQIVIAENPTTTTGEPGSASSLVLNPLSLIAAFILSIYQYEILLISRLM